MGEIKAKVLSPPPTQHHSFFRNWKSIYYSTAATSFIPRYAETHDAEPQDTHQRATPGNCKLPVYPLPSISSNLAFRLAIHIFTKTRYSSHINCISRCIQHKVIPKGFRSNFHASIFSNVSNFNLKYLHEIQPTQNTFSRNKLHSL